MWIRVSATSKTLIVPAKLPGQGKAHKLSQRGHRQMWFSEIGTEPEQATDPSRNANWFSLMCPSSTQEHELQAKIGFFGDQLQSIS